MFRYLMAVFLALVLINGLLLFCAVLAWGHYRVTLSCALPGG